MSSKSLAIDLIRTDGGTQMRAELTQDVYMDYRDKWLAGVQFDPVDVFHDGAAYWLADGFHRFYGAREAKRGSIPCRIHQGTQRDAILFACGANATHGLRRKNEDKQRSVRAILDDPEWCKWSDSVIAEKCHVTQPFVGGIRKQLITVIGSPAEKAADQPRVGRDGKKRRPPAKQVLAAKPACEPKKYNDDFTPAKIESQKPKNGSESKATFNDSAFDDLFGKVIRMADERWNLVGGNATNYRNCIGKLREAYDAFKDWRKS